MVDDDKVSIKTYIPRYQKEKWTSHADELNMSQSEFIRTMVQAGRCDFKIPSLEKDVGNTNNKTDSDDLQKRILSILNEKEAVGWDELIDKLIDDIEDDVDQALEQLQDNNRLRYSGRRGGYVLVDHE